MCVCVSMIAYCLQLNGKKALRLKADVHYGLPQWGGGVISVAPSSGKLTVT